MRVLEIWLIKIYGHHGKLQLVGDNLNRCRFCRSRDVGHKPTFPHKPPDCVSSSPRNPADSFTNTVHSTHICQEPTPDLIHGGSPPSHFP